MSDNAAHLSSRLESPGGFVYKRHKPEETELYKIIEQHLSSFQSHLSNAVRRQTLWNHLTLFLSDTFLPVTSPV